MILLKICLEHFTKQGFLWEYLAAAQAAVEE